MAETHVLSALKTKREEMAAEARALADAISHVDATIRLFEGGKPREKQRHISRDVFRVMQEAGKPMTGTEIAARVDAPVKRVMGTLCYQKDRGRVRGRKVAGAEIMWELVG